MRPPPRLALLGIALAVLLLHLLVLLGWPLGVGDRLLAEGVQPLARMQVRRIEASRPEAPAPPERATPAVRAKASVPEAPAAPVAPGAPVASTPAVEPAPTGAPSAAEAPVAAAGGQAVPLYATAPAPAAELDFELRRGLAGGEGELRWAHDGQRYELSLRSLVGGAEALGWLSRGGFDAHGLAPERYVARRRGRDWQAVSFLRESGRITFSASTVELPLLPGAQDRVSWMLQVAAIVRANPALAAPGSEVSMWVLGARGEAEVWTFLAQAPATLELPIGRVEGALHFVREPRRPYDTQVQIWLDPAREHLPVRALLLVRPTGESTEFALRALRLR
jgi:hypothetical protein